MAEYCLALRHAHIGLVILSIGLFVLRGGLMLAESPSTAHPGIMNGW